MVKKHEFGFVEKFFVSILIIIFGGIVLHAPFSVFFGTLFPDLELLGKSWKEILMLIAGLLSLILLYKNNKFKLLKNPILILSAVYAVIHLICVCFASNPSSALAGLSIDLRYVFFFDLVYIAINLYPYLKNVFVKVGAAGAIIVTGFALLQVFVLPKDILTYIGYSRDTIDPYLMIDQNENYIRINSTLRGPNPLGAYAMTVLSLILAAVSLNFARIKKNRRLTALLSVFGFASLVTLWFSYSRSAWLAAAISAGLIFGLLLIKKKMSQKSLIIIGAGLVVVLMSLFMLRNTAFVSNVLVHNNPNDSSDINSNDGHASSLADGWNSFITEPFGGGVGSTGSASLYTERPLIIENQYLFTAHEVGWLGLLVFVAIFSLILTKLWRDRKNWLSLGLFASGVGLFLIGILLPVWVDDTVSIIWWGMAALVYSGSKKE